MIEKRAGVADGVPGGRIPVVELLSAQGRRVVERCPAMATTLASVHANPEFPPTEERLSARVGMKRDAFHRNFVHLLGLKPIEYVTLLRLYRVRDRWLDPLAKKGALAVAAGFHDTRALAAGLRRARATIERRPWGIRCDLFARLLERE